MYMALDSIMDERWARLPAKYRILSTDEQSVDHWNQSMLLTLEECPKLAILVIVRVAVHIARKWRSHHRETALHEEYLHSTSLC